MGLLDDINNAFDPKKNGVADAFDPNKNGVADAFKTAGDKLDQTFDPNKNNVANTFNNDFPKYFNTVGNSMNDIFGKGGFLDNKIGEPSKNFFDNTLPTGANQFFNNIDNKIGEPTKLFFDQTLPTGANQFFNDVGQTVGKTVGGTLFGTVSSGTQTRQLDPQPNNGKAITSDTKDVTVTPVTTKTDFVIPLVVGGAILAFVMLKK